MAKRRKKPKRGKNTVKIIYSDDWGQIQEQVKYRDTRPGKKGRFVKSSSANRFKTYKPIRETYQYRLDSQGRRSEPVVLRTSKTLTKSTIPGRIDIHDGNIWQSIRDSNLFTEIHHAKNALVNVIGFDEDGRRHRFQVKIDKFGRDNQDLQLSWAIAEYLENYDFGSQYNIKLVKRRGIKAAEETAKIRGLFDVQITTTLRF